MESRNIALMGQLYLYQLWIMTMDYKRLNIFYQDEQQRYLKTLCPHFYPISLTLVGSAICINDASVGVLSIVYTSCINLG